MRHVCLLKPGVQAAAAALPTLAEFFFRSRSVPATSLIEPNTDRGGLVSRFRAAGAAKPAPEVFGGSLIGAMPAERKGKAGVCAP
jgi:hypothetical protein